MGEANAQRVMGLDTSSAANATAPSQALWDTAFSQGYRFAWVRSSRGGLTASEARLDDGHFYDNISRATQAGLLTGSYHFSRPDLSTTATPTPGTNTAVGDADHYLQQAGMYMKPGYLLPVFDLEDGDVENSATALTTWSIDFLNRIEQMTGVVPIVYSNSNYINNEVTAAIAWHNVDTTAPIQHTNPRTYQWLARPGSNGLTGDPPPASGFANPYGFFDPSFNGRFSGPTPVAREPAVKPWAFWQQTLDTTPAGLFKIDIDFANGNIEFVKDFLVPALWINAGSGDWGTQGNWNSDNPTYNGTIQSGPAPRLPDNSALDWVKLQNAGDGTVTISSGARTVRKFYTQQQLDINGGSLTVAYVPGSGGKWDLPSEFNAVVNLASGAAYTAHTTQVDGNGGQFNLNGGTVTASEIQLASHASNSGKIAMGGNVTFAPYGGAGTTVIRSIGSLAQSGSISLNAGNQTFSVNNGSAGVDLNVRVGVSGTGRLVKSGTGTMQLSNANSYTGGTTVSSGVLQIAAEDRLGAVPGSVDVDNIALNGGTLRTGAQINSVSLTNAGSGYTSFPTLTINGGGASVHAASANVLAGIGSIAVASGGSGYVNQISAPAANGAGTFVDIVGGGGTGATAFATVVGGVVQSITVTNPGTGYTSMPTIFISSTIPTGGPTFAGTGAVANISGIDLQGMALNDGGFDYTTPTISLTGGGGSGATASATSTPGITLPANRGIDLGFTGGTLIQTAATTLTVNGTITAAGNGSLTKDGPGTLTLNGSSSNYTGATIINQGILNATTPTSIGNDMGVLFVNNTNNTGPGTDVVLNLSTTGPTTKGALIGSIATPTSGTNTVTINNGGQMFTVNQLAFDINPFSGVIAGSGGFTLGSISITELKLSGANIYSGGTIVNGGTLTALGPSALGATTGTLAVNNPNTGPGTNVILNLSTTAPTTTGSLSGTVAVPSSGANTAQIVTGGGQLFTINQTNFGTFAGTISGNGSLVLGSGSTSTLLLGGANTYTGNTFINGGALQISSNASLGSTSNSIIFDGGKLIIGGGFTQTRNATLNAGGGTIESPLPGTFGGVISGAGNLTKTGGTSLTLSNANTYTGTTTISAGTLQIGNGGTTGSLASPSIVDNGILTFNRSDDHAYGGVISGTGAVSKLGAGKLSLTGTNTYTGLTTIFTGTLEIGGGGTTGSIVSNIVNNGALIFNRSNSYSYAGAVSGTGALTQTGTGTLTLAGSNSYGGNTVINAGVLEYSTSANLGSASNSIAFGGGTLRTLAAGTQARAVALNAGGGTIDTNAFDSTFSGNFTGSSGLTKIGAGKLTLTGTNNYTGGTTVSAGTLQGTTSSLQGSITNNAAVIFDQSATGVYSGNMSGTGSLTKSNTGHVTLSGTNSYTGGTTHSAGVLVGNTNSLQGNITNNASLIFNQGSAGTYAGDMSGIGSLVKQGAGTLILTGTNTYNAGTTVNSGILQGNTTSLQGSIQVVSSVVFDQPTNGTHFGTITSIGSLTKTGAGTLIFGGPFNSYSGGTTVSGGTLQGTTSSLQGNITNNAAVTFDQTTNGAYTGNISGTGSLTKSGSGTVNLTGANNYTGATTVNAGTLSSNGFKGGGPLTVANGTTAVVPEAAPNTYDGAMVVPAGQNSTGSKVSGLTISGTGVLDLGNSDMAIDYVDPNTPLDTVRDLIASGYNGGGWDGAGIVSNTVSANNPNQLDPGVFGLGYAENGALPTPYGNLESQGGPLFSDQDVDLTTVLIKFTWVGDLNLDGLVDFSDLSVFNTTWDNGQSTGRYWFEGDFNYDGLLDFSDLSLFNTNYDPNKPSLPEPGTLGLVGLLVPCLVRRTR